jgi:outer membrane immunogenic protein
MLATTALVVLGGASYAADLPAGMPFKAPIAAPGYSWSSCYVGVHAGTGWDHTDWSDPGTSIPLFSPPPVQSIAPLGASISTNGSAGFLAGGQIGCDWQFAGNWVIGLAGDFSWASIKSQGTDPFFAGKGGNPITLQAKTDWLASATGRIGYAFDRVLVYGKGGIAFDRDRYNAINLATLAPTFNPTASTTRTGWVAGVGAEWAFADNWSVFAEYDHYGFGKKTLNFIDPVNFPNTAVLTLKQDVDVVKVGLNFRFHLPGS